MWSEDRNHDYRDCVGFVCPFFEYIYEWLARKYRLELVIGPLEKGIGEEISPGNWTGVLGILHRNEADLLGVFFSLIPEVFRIVSFANPHAASTSSVLSGPPAKLHEENSSVFSAFSFQFWFILISSWIVVTCLYRSMVRLEAAVRPSQERELSLLETALTFYGLLVQRGFDNLPTTLSRRLVVTGWLLLVTVLTGLIGGTFSAMLAITPKPERIDTVQDILKYPHVRPYAAIGSGPDYALKFSSIKEQQMVWDQVIRHNATCKLETFFTPEFMDEISEGRAVGIGLVEMLLDVAVSLDCPSKPRPFYVAREPCLTQPFAMMFRKGLPNAVQEDINQMVTLYGGMGLFSRLAKDIRRLSQPCYGYAFSKSAYRPLNMKDTRQVFMLLVYGYALVTFVLLAELALVISARRIKLNNCLSQM